MRPAFRVIPVVILAAFALLCLGSAPSGDGRAVAAPALTPTATVSAVPASPCAPAWQAVPVPTSSPLSGVAGTGPADAWAVGATYSETGVLHWDGSAWRAFATPPSGHFGAVAASGPDDVWVAGSTDTGVAAAAAHWDGAAWQAVCCTADAPAAHSEVLSGIAVSAPGDAWAVGLVDSSGAVSPLVYHCVDAGCTAQEAPPGATALQAVSAPAPSEVWVAGWAHLAPNPPADVSYLAHWDGAWTALTCPDIGRLDGVAATGPNDVWAINSGQSGSLLHWDGQACHEVPLPAPAAAVVALAPDDAWAAGSVFQHWDGVAWQVVPGVSGLQVAALAAAGPVDVWAVGQDAQGFAASAHYAVPPAFADVPVPQPFYGPIEDLACRGLVSGYTCGGPGEPCVPPANLPYYRVGASVTRGQVTKMVVLGAGWPLLTPATPTFADVPRGQPFYAVIETAAAHGIISGYACGGPGEPCDSQHRPYFRPSAPVTRGQIAKIVTLGAGYPIPAPPTPTFADVPGGSPFYGYVEAAAGAGLISGYACGGPGEPCDAQHRPYFRPGASATRGQTAKIVDLSLAGGLPGGP